MAGNHPRFDDDLAVAEAVKRLTISALVSEDDLFDLLVLKGGNAIEHAGVAPVRRSIDVDFSLDGSLESLGSVDQLRSRFDRLLSAMFKQEGFRVFDVRLEKHPPNLKEDVLGDFWGGYQLRFKVINADSSDGLSTERLRKRAFSLGPSDRKEFNVDLSKHEFCGGKILKEIGGFSVYVYTGQMIICEKIRAICQQMAEYRKVVKSSSACPRARDFFDIHYIASQLAMDFRSDEFWDTLTQVFEVKRVPLYLLGQISDHREFHRENFESVKNTVRKGVDLQDFDFYVDFLVDRLAFLESRWIVDPPSA